MYNIYEVISVNVREMRKALGITQSEFAVRYNIPFRTIQNWETEQRKPPEYILDLLEKRIKEDAVNRRTVKLPEYDPKKEDLPKRRDYIGAVSWLKAVREQMNEDVVFALDEALMCQGNFGGHSDEFLVWVYGNDSLTRFNGIVVLGNKISPYCVENKNGLCYTDFNRTLSDALANEQILDMQGITEAISKYYYANGDSFNGISVPPEYQDRFEALAKEAVAYYE